MKDAEQNKEADFSKMIDAKEKLKLKGQQKNKQGLWFGLGMFGLIGWTIAVPTFLGILFGIWLDHKFPGKHSWTITFLLLGLITGCVSAWLWVSKEHKNIGKDEEP